MKRATLPPTLRVAIARTVILDHNGSAEDVEDLTDVWERVQRVNGERADRIRRQAREAAERLGRIEAARSGGEV
jgi:hypothetical protein